MHCPAMYIKPGTGLVDPTDVDLDEDLQRFAARKKWSGCQRSGNCKGIQNNFQFSPVAVWICHISNWEVDMKSDQWDEMKGVALQWELLKMRAS